MFEPIHVLTTTAQQHDAQRIAQTLLEKRLAACVQVAGPITSTYRWQGQVETSQEWLCIAKTDRAHYQAVEDEIRRMHPYEVPEIVATPIVAGSPGYLHWLQDALKHPGADL